MNQKINRQKRPSLTKREQKVIRLAAEDKRNKEIAAALGISEDTVHNRWAHIYDKPDVHSRAAAVAWLLRQTAMT